ncbi:hypothetical protein [Methylobacterium nigriterrae]|uniref:hypothetical protein n=1 Tax=Methylobacterium nigriterrae TaxID=3127512 RepID=UPI003013A3C6
MEIALSCPPIETPGITLSVGENVPHQIRAALLYTLDEIAVRLGRRIQLAVGETDISYGGTQGRTLVPFEPTAWGGEAMYEVRWLPSGRAVWANPAKVEVDLIGGVFRLLTLADEASIPETARNGRGVFRVTESSRRNSSAIPLVEHHVAELASQLGLASPIRPWPNGSVMALVMTHDTDAVDLSALSEITINTTKYLLRRDPAYGELAKLGWRERARAPVERSYFGSFEAWANVERAYGICSAFYLFHRRRVRRRLNDCRSTVFNRAVDWTVLRRLASEGWEFGLHSAIEAKTSLDEFVDTRNDIERALGQPVAGLRHHYWALDWRKPYLTWRKHVNAGFRYDLSCAWQDAPGFRAGTSLPYRPWDPERRKALDLYVVPTAIMDGHVISGTGFDVARRRADEVIETIRAVGGVAMLDWHTETAFNRLAYEGYRDVAEQILSRWSGSSTWAATPWKLVSHWHTWRKQISLGDG